MPQSQLIANYTDPVYNNIKSAFAQRSDEYPVVMLPVRLETRFMNETRIIRRPRPGRGTTPGGWRVTLVMQKIYSLLKDIRIWADKAKGLPEIDIISKLSAFEAKINKAKKPLNKIVELNGDDRRILREATDDLRKDLNKLKFKTRGVKTKVRSLKGIADQLKLDVEEIKSPAESSYQKGYDYLDALNKIGKSIETIYVKRTTNAKNIDTALLNIDTQINAINTLIKSADFKATAGTIAKIKSKISYIKRIHKSSPVRLRNLKIGYTGKRNLKTTEYTLRGDINGLKTRIDEEHVPYMNLVEQLKEYPVRRLTYRVDKAFYLLRAANANGYAKYKNLIKTKEWLYDELLPLRERAHRPLEGEFDDITTLKTRYAKLESEIKKFIKKSKKFKPSNQYKRASLTRLRTHLTDEYLEDLKDLLPGVKNIEEQTFEDSKVRSTSMSAMATSKNLNQLRDLVKNSSQSPEVALKTIKTALTSAKAQIAVSASNTILLPQATFRQLQGTVNSLKSHLNNLKNRNQIPGNNKVLEENKTLIDDIENIVLDQQTDVFNARDRFYDSYRKRITFTLYTESVQELWVRIYPDDIAVDNHDERITDEEEKIAQDYYYEVYSKLEAERETTKLPAWRAAAASLGVRRAAYLIKVLVPTEVTANTVTERVNAMDAELAKAKGFLPERKILRLRTDLATDQDFIDYLNELPKKTQDSLGTSSFSICLENKATLDKFLDALKRFNKNLKIALEKADRGTDQESIEKLLELIRTSYNIVTEFYTDNLEGLNQAFKPQLTFKIIEKKTQTWDRAGITEVLPDRFVVVTKRGGQYKHIVTGKPITKPLQLSIDPTGDQADSFSQLPNGDMNVPEELKWMFDFDAAVDAGMAVRIPLDSDDYELGFELVMAFGIQDTDAQTGQETIDKLFTNHLYSDGGLEYLPVGTATNNTDEVKSPYNGLDNDFDGAFDLFIGADSPQYLSYSASNELKMQDGQYFKDALGLPNNVADYIRNYDKMDIAQGRAMNRVLYNATLKYYMSVMVKSVINKNDIDHTLPFMMQNLSAVGTVPSFRIDQQPYGVLPITNYSAFKVAGSTVKSTEGSYMKNLTIFLNATRRSFDGFTNQPQTVNGQKYLDDPQQEFLKILGLEPYSKEFFYRFGTNISSRWSESSEDNLEFPINWENVDSEFDFTPAKVANHYSLLMKELGYKKPDLQSRVIEGMKAYVSRYMYGNYIVGAKVQDPEIGVEKLADVTAQGLTGAPFSGNYIDWLSTKNRNSLIGLDVEDIPPVNVDGELKIQNTLLFMMMRGGLLYDSSAFALRAFPILSALNVPTLERLMANHLDLCSYRLDAWLGGLSDYRLKELRKTKPTGSYVGAYGFLQDLKPAPPLEKANNLPSGLTPDNGKDVYKMPENQGFIHGPSMNHAITAAVLRAGYQSLKERGNNNNALAINLSSSRVRQGLKLLEGVGNGQEAGALLGYMLERALHEKYTDGVGNPLEMDVYIYRLRRKFPTFGDMPKDSDIDLTQNENVKAANVVDGLAMIDYFEEEMRETPHWDDDSTFVDMIIDDSGSTPVFNGHPWGLGNEVPNPSSPPAGSNATKERLKLRAIIHELDNMADAFDALGDLMTAEGVYQLVRGNHVRASAVLNALAEGKVPLDPEIIKSMRTGIMVTHRALLNIPVNNSQTSPWAGVSMSPRAKAEPSLNNWLATQIGDADKIDWFAKFGNTETHLTLEDLGMQPIDLVLMVTAGGQDGLEEIETRCVNYLRANGAIADDKIELNFNEHSVNVEVSFGEIVSLLQNLGKTMAASRPADARDYRISEDELNFELTAGGIDTVEVLGRINTALADYETLLADLAVFTAEKTTYSVAETDLAYNKLIELSGYGFAGFYPALNAKDDVLSMAGKIVTAKTKMTENIAFVQSTTAALALELDQIKWISSVAAMALRLFGNGFKMMPQFANTNATALREQLDMNLGEGILRNHPEGYINEWLNTTALVRNRLAPIESVRLLTDVLFENQESILPAQLPFTEPADIADRDYWMGAEYPETFVPDGDRLSLICIGQENVAATGCGLILDEWMEIIPDKKETTGIAMHYNQPDARAPQTVLLAVTPEKTGSWKIEDLALSVEEALNMAKLRAVEPEHVDFSMYSQLLPATTTLAFGFDEMIRRLDPDFNEEEQDLGLYIDYTAVNHGVDPDEND